MKLKIGDWFMLANTTQPEDRGRAGSVVMSYADFRKYYAGVFVVVFIVFYGLKRANKSPKFCGKISSILLP